jgi:hypothetical protein
LGGWAENDLSLLPGQANLEKKRVCRPRHLFFIGALYSVIALALLAGCDKKDDAISTAEQADKKSGIAAPGIAET